MNCSEFCGVLWDPAVSCGVLRLSDLPVQFSLCAANKPHNTALLTGGQSVLVGGCPLKQFLHRHHDRVSLSSVCRRNEITNCSLA